MDIVALRRQSPDTLQSGRTVTEQSAGRGTSRHDGVVKLQVWRVLSMGYLVIVVVVGLWLELELLMSSPSETWQGEDENLYVIASQLMEPSQWKVQLYNCVCMGLAIVFLGMMTWGFFLCDRLSCNACASVYSYFNPTSLAWEVNQFVNGLFRTFSILFPVTTRCGLLYLEIMLVLCLYVQAIAVHNMVLSGCRLYIIPGIYLFIWSLFLQLQLWLCFLSKKFALPIFRERRRVVMGVCNIMWHHIAATNICLFVRTIFNGRMFFDHSTRIISNGTSGNCTIPASTNCSYCQTQRIDFSYIETYPIVCTSVIIFLVLLLPLYVHILKTFLNPTFQQQDTSRTSEYSIFRKVLQSVTATLKSLHLTSKQQRAVLSAGCILLAICIVMSVVANQVEIQQSFIPLLICRSITALLMSFVAVAGLVTLRHNVRSPSHLPVSDIFLMLAVLFVLLCDKIANMVVCGFSLSSSSTMRGQSVLGMIEQVTWIFQSILQTSMIVTALRREGRYAIACCGLAHISHVASILIFLNLGVGIFEQFGGNLSYMYNPSTEMYLGIETDTITSYQVAWSWTRPFTSPSVVLFRIVSCMFCFIIRKQHSKIISALKSERNEGAGTSMESEV